eukprot:TRINITY_DN57974_c0_g1_i1.p1 TRINITY_DN57974_c0_g1~~TRINITY_DN57974_c0_g1_i1.p1  ORF type:complete len:324 (-),score=75.72 TRINITY_DN57974_c0_g1_i1:128-1012(-)
MDAKALLDSLMGPSRDKPLSEQQKGDGWKEKNVCKRFLVGFCPNSEHDNWFHNTRRDVGVCTKVHSERLKSDFEKHPDRKKYQQEYEMEFLKYLEGLNAEADAWISREKGNCASVTGKVKLSESAKQNIEKLKEEADQAMRSAEDLAETGDIAGSKKATEKARKAQEDIESIKANDSFISKGDQVCDVCGIRCNTDDMSNYEAHMNSNLHRAYTQTRQKAKELREAMKNYSREKEGSKKESEKDGGDERGGARSERGRDRDRDRDRERERDRDRERQRGGRSERERSRSRRRRR